MRYTSRLTTIAVGIALPALLTAQQPSPTLAGRPTSDTAVKIRGMEISGSVSGRGKVRDGAGQQVPTPVTTAQIAPTILAMLGLDPMALDAVRLEGTRPLPGGAE